MIKNRASSTTHSTLADRGKSSVAKFLGKVGTQTGSTVSKEHGSGTCQGIIPRNGSSSQNVHRLFEKPGYRHIEKFARDKEAHRKQDATPG